MRIYKMRATFGKLEDQVLELNPGLNVIEAPNEWGKSTWCAFLVAMLYGIETRARTSQATLAEKEKYAPWSGRPMEGRIDLCWQGRNITIERRSKGRTPFGQFKAYETATGMEVPELTAANCGQLLLGVERSVFSRAGFLRLNDLPVTQDEALRRRLNALVTTGDESGAGDVLAAKLKELKNNCRYHRTGLLPRAEAELADLEGKQQELVQLNREAEENLRRQEQTQMELLRLKNHQAALRYRASLEDQARVRAAEEIYTEADARRDACEEECALLPSRETAEDKRRQLRDLQQKWMSLQTEIRSMPGQPERPEPETAFEGVTVYELNEHVRADARTYDALREKMGKRPVLGWILAILGLLGVAAGAVLQLWAVQGVAALVMVAGIVVIALARKQHKELAAEADALASRYPWREPQQWVTEAESYVNRLAQYETRMEQYRAAMESLDQSSASIRSRMNLLTQGQELGAVLERLQQVVDAWNELDDARADLKQAESHLKSIRAMARTAQPPEFEDSLLWSEPETNRLVVEYTSLQGQQREQLGKIRGAMIAIGDERLLQSRIDGLRRRIGELEETVDALDMAQQVLAAATEQLQRRFAPRITERTRELFATLTDGRYDRLNLTRELSLDAAAAGETTLHSAQWRSEGTVDQLYFALRLAVAEELTPVAPLVLDDALVRFDDCRLKNAMTVLDTMAQSKQVILFTCQSRESALCP